MTGWARSLVLLAILYLVFKYDIDLRSAVPHLYESILRIYVYYMPQESPEAHVLRSMKLSAAGSIRKAYNVMEMVGAFRTLQDLGSGPLNLQIFVRKHNMNNSSGHQIVGAKATTMKLLVEGASNDVLDFILNYVGEVGIEDSVFCRRLVHQKDLPWASVFREEQAMVA